MSQINIHTLMLQNKMQIQNVSTTAFQQTDIIQNNLIHNDRVESHCSKSTTNVTSENSHISSKNMDSQCQSFISIADSLGTNANLSVTFPDFSSVTFFVPLNKNSSRQNNDYQNSIYHLLIKTFSPPIVIKLHAFLI